MFKDMFGLMNKLNEAKSKMEETKNRLSEIIHIGESENGKVMVECTGNRKITSIKLDDLILAESNKEKLQLLIIEAANSALQKAEKNWESEMKGAAKDMLPNIPGLF